MSVDLPAAVADIVQNERNPLRAFLRLEEFYRMADAEQRAAIREGWPFGRDWSVPGLDYSDGDRIVFAPLVGEDADGLDAQARIDGFLPLLPPRSAGRYGCRFALRGNGQDFGR